MKKILITEKQLNYLLDETNTLDELGITDHYTDRKYDRVANIDKVIVSKSALGEYSLSEVQEPLINFIKEYMNNKLKSLESLDRFGISENAKVAYKIFEPILIGVDKEKYPITIISPPSEEDIALGKNRENIGTYYYVIIADHTLISLILSSSDDFESDVKRHESRLGFDRPVKVLNVKSEIEIDLNRLMGKEVELPKTKLVNPDDLEYKVRGDYRTKDGGKFDHKKFGRGKIVDTSNGRTGEPDVRGMLDWVDVVFPSLGGKKIRFNRVYAKKYFDLQEKFGGRFRNY